MDLGDGLAALSDVGFTGVEREGIAVIWTVRPRVPIIAVTTADRPAKMHAKTEAMNHGSESNGTEASAEMIPAPKDNELWPQFAWYCGVYQRGFLPTGRSSELMPMAAGQRCSFL